MDAPEVSENAPIRRPVAVIREGAPRAKREAGAPTPLRRDRPVLSVEQIVRAAVLLVVGFACAAGLHAGSAKALGAAGDAERPLGRMVNIDR